MLRLDLNGLIDANAENFVPAVTMVEGAPRAHTSATVGQFLVLGATKDPMTEYDFNTPRVQWSAIGDPTDWRLRTEEGQETGNLPGAQTFSNLHGVISIAASERNMIVFGSNAIVLGTLIGAIVRFQVRYHLAKHRHRWTVCSDDVRKGCLLPVSGWVQNARRGGDGDAHRQECHR